MIGLIIYFSGVIACLILGWFDVLYDEPEHGEEGGVIRVSDIVLILCVSLFSWISFLAVVIFGHWNTVIYRRKK